MADTNGTPWILAKPGEVIAADKWNEMQLAAQKAIEGSAGTLDGKIEEVSGKLASIDAVMFGGKTAAEWEALIREVAQKQKFPTTQAFFKTLTTAQPSAFINHDAGDYPILDVYELTDVAPAPPTGLEGIKLLVYFGHTEAETLNIMQFTGQGAPTDTPVISLEGLLRWLAMEPESDDTLNNVLERMWSAFKRKFIELPHKTTANVDAQKAKTIADLKKDGTWGQLYVAIRPVKVSGKLVTPNVDATVTHVSHWTAHVALSGLAGAAVPAATKIDLLILARS